MGGEPLAWLAVPDDADVPDEARAVWAEAAEKLGFVPNVMRVFALRPRHFLAWWGYYDDLLRGDSRLTKAQREMIAVAVSVENDCHY